MLGFSAIAAGAIAQNAVDPVLPAAPIVIGTLPQVVQQPDLGGGYIELFDLDASALHGEGGVVGQVYHFTPATKAGYLEILWQGRVYYPIPIQAAGFEWTTEGAQPRPNLSVSNIGGLLMSAVTKLGDLVGAKLTRWRTLSQYLDDGPQADPTAHFPIDSYYIEEKTSHTAESIQWTLSSIIDRPNILLPRRQVLRDTINGMPGFPGVSRIKIS